MDPDDVFKIIAITIDALNSMQKIAHSGPDRPQDALQTITIVIDVLRDGLTGETSPDVVAAELKALFEIEERRNAPNIQDKFDPGGDS